MFFTIPVAVTLAAIIARPLVLAALITIALRAVVLQVWPAVLQVWKQRWESRS